MRKLLVANFARLWRNIYFWLGLIFMIVFGVCRMGIAVVSGAEAIDDGVFLFNLVIILVQGAFVTLFVGNEHHCNTLRNKLVVGHLRRDVYLSNIIVCIVAGCLFCFGYITSSLLVGLPTIGSFRAEIPQLVTSVGCSLLLVAVYSSIFVFIAMLKQNMAVSSVVCLLLAVGFFIAGLNVMDQLNQPEQYEIVEFDNNGSMLSVQYKENPLYLRGSIRSVFEFLCDCFPGCQSIRLSYMYDEISTPSPKLVFYDLFILIFLNWIGILSFQKKNLK